MQVIGWDYLLPGRGMLNINHISVSRKKCFDECAQRYKYRYELNLPGPEPPPFYFVYGIIIHKIAEEYVRRKGETPIGDIAKDVMRGRIEIEPGKRCPSIPSDYAKKMQKHLRSIQNLTDKIGVDGEVEYKFYYDLDPPHERFITGFLDRLIINGDKAFIIDYKTTKKGKWRVNKETVATDLQLKTYARVVQRNFGLKAENIKAALFYVDGEELVACSYNEDALQQVEKQLLESYTLIKNADADKVWGKVSWHCQHCDYVGICPFYKASGSNNSEVIWDGDMSTI